MSYQASATTSKFYKGIVDEVINSSREPFLDEGFDEQVLQELRQIWESKIIATKAVDSLSDNPPPPPSSATGNSASASSSSHSRSQHHTQHHNQPPPTQITNQPSGNTEKNPKLEAGIATANANQVTVVQATAAPTSVLVATPTALPLDHAAAVGAFQQLNPQHIFRPTATSAVAAAANFAAFQPGVIATQNGQSIILQAAGNVGVPTIRYLSPQLPTIPAQLMQINQHQLSQQQRRNGNLPPQGDGPTGISDDEEDFDGDDDAPEENDEPVEAAGVEEGEPLNSEDDVSNEDAEEMFEADNVVVCQYEKVTRTRNKWKFVLKDGVINLDGKDYVFNRANGEAEF